MAAVGPYGIEQFDAPGIISNMQNVQFNRIRMMAAQKSLEMMDRQMAIQSGMMKMGSDFINRIYGGGSGGSSSNSSSEASPSASSGPSPPQVQSAMSTASSLPAVGPMTGANAAIASAPASTAAPSTPSGTMGSSLNMPPQSITNQAAPMLGMMGFLNPDQAQAMGNVFKNMDAAQLEGWSNKNHAIVGELTGLLQVPYAQRKAAIQQAAGDFQQLGYSPQQLAGFDPTDGNIRMEIGKHMDADHIATMINPTYENMRANGAVARIQPYGDSAVVAQSPYIQGPHGNVYGSGAPTATNPKTGERMQYNSQTGAWEPIGGPTPPASGGFQ